MQQVILANAAGKSRKHVLYAFVITTLFCVFCTHTVKAQQVDSLKCDTSIVYCMDWSYSSPVSIVYYIDPLCSIEVSYIVRTCSYSDDIRILSIKPYGCYGYSGKYLMALALQKTLVALLPPGDTSKNFRVLRNSCWRFDTVWTMNWQGHFVQEVIFNPCDSGCCVKLFRVVRNTTDEIHQLGTLKNDTCQYVQGNSGCTGICDTNESTMILAKKHSSEMRIKLNSTNETIQRSFKQGTELNFSLTQTVASTVNIKVSNVQGNTVYQLYGIYVPSGNHMLNVPSDILQSGTYELTIESGNKIIKTSVFQIY